MMSEASNEFDFAVSRGMALAYHASRQPDAIAVTCPFGDRSYAQLNQRTNQLVRFLRTRGVGAGSAIAVVTRNRAEFVETLSAATRGGLRFTPVNFHLTADEIGYIVDNCDAAAVVYDAGLGTGVDALAQAPNCSVRLAVGGDVEGFESYEAAIDPFDANDITDPVHGTAMFYTSGTTGRPKGVHRKAQPTPTAASASLTGESPSTVNLCTGPMYHGAPLVMNVTAPLNAGSKLVLMNDWDAEETLQLISEHRVTHTHMVSTMFHRLLQLPQDTKDKYDLSSLSRVVHGAAPCPIHVKRAIIEWFGPVVYEYFNATEGGNIYMIDSETWLRKPGSVGTTPQPQNTRILDEEAVELAPGETGYIYFKAPEKGRFEYYKAADKTAKAYRGDWFTLGDMGYVDEDGFLFLNGRSAETIISGGVNIYPQEIDDVLLQHEAVFDVCTIGAPNDEWGEEVKAVIQLPPGHHASQELVETILEYAKEHLPAFKRPRSIDFVDELPRLSSGKVQRNVVRSSYWSDQTRNI